MADKVNVSVDPPVWFHMKIFQQLLDGWIAMKFCTGIHDLQRMNATLFGYHLTFLVAPPPHIKLCFFNILKTKTPANRRLLLASAVLSLVLS